MRSKLDDRPSTSTSTSTTGAPEPDTAAPANPRPGSSAREGKSPVRRIDLIAPRGPRARKIIGIAVLALVVGSVVALLAPRFWGLPSDAAFRVRDTVVTSAELQRRVDLLGALYGIKPPPDEAGKDGFRRDSAKAVAVTTVLDQAAARRGIVIPDKVARDILTKMINEQLAPQGGQRAYVKLLSDTGASDGDVVEEVKRQQRTEQLYTQVTAPTAASVTAADVERYYREHPAEMVAPEQRHVRNIVVADEKEAADLRQRLSGGADFAATAAESSLDESTRGAGGELGFIDKTKLEPAFGDAAFSAPPGGFFGPVRSQFGWNVGQVMEVRPATPLSLDQVRQDLDAKLRSDRASTEWQHWLDREVADADVEYGDDFRPAEQGVATPARSADGPSDVLGVPQEVVLIGGGCLAALVVAGGLRFGLRYRRNRRGVVGTAAPGDPTTTRWRARRPR